MNEVIPKQTNSLCLQMPTAFYNVFTLYNVSVALYNFNFTVALYNKRWYLVVWVISLVESNDIDQKKRKSDADLQCLTTA